MLWKTTTLAAVAGLALAGLARADESLVTIDQGFRNAAPRALSYLKEHGCKNVGVLKFLVKVGDAVYKIQLISYYSTTSGASGYPTIRYRQIQ